MKNLRSLFTCGIVAIFAFTFFFANQKAEAGSQRIIPTNCVIKSTGEIVGYSNNCGSGGSTCTDNDCSGTLNPTITHAN